MISFYNLIFFLPIRRGSNRVDSLTIKRVEHGLLKTHALKMKIHCVCQSRIIACSVLETNCWIDVL